MHRREALNRGLQVGAALFLPPLVMTTSSLQPGRLPAISLTEDELNQIRGKEYLKPDEVNLIYPQLDLKFSPIQPRIKHSALKAALDFMPDDLPEGVWLGFLFYNINVSPEGVGYDVYLFEEDRNTESSSGPMFHHKSFAPAEPEFLELVGELAMSTDLLMDMQLYKYLEIGGDIPDEVIVDVYLKTMHFYKEHGSIFDFTLELGNVA